MRGTIAPTTLVIVLATVFVLGILPRAQAGDPTTFSDQTVSDQRRAECSNASLEGSFGFTSAGTLFALPAPFAGPFGEIGRQTFDGKGDTEGTATLSANGNIVKGVNWQGTYEVNPDCTGSMTILILPFGVTADLDFVIDDDGAELRAIATGTGSVETRVYRKQFSRGRKN
jgi:hypothetical protein